jgi:hypothetical protein
MEEKKFSTLYVGELKLSHLFGLNKETIEVAIPLRNALTNLPDAALTQLEQVNEKLNKRLSRPLGSLITAELRQLDTKRDRLFEEIKRNVKTASKSSDPMQNQAGKKLFHFLNPWWSTEKQALMTETGLLSIIIERYRDTPELRDSASLIGIDRLWDELDQINMDFNMLYYERNAEFASKEEAASKLKNNAVKSYETFCILVEQAANLMPTTDLITLFDQMDILRKTYHALAFTKKEKED